LDPEIYADVTALKPYVTRLQRLPAPLVIDHVGMTEAGLPVVLDVVAAGPKVKATDLDLLRRVPGVELARRPCGTTRLLPSACECHSLRWRGGSSSRPGRLAFAARLDLQPGGFPAGSLT
jgi:hypothetical protein